MSDFKITEEAEMKALETLDPLLDYGIYMMEQLYASGQSTSEAGSIMANLYAHTAWKLAQMGVLGDGREPNPDNFRKAVDIMLERNPPVEISFEEEPKD